MREVFYHPKVPSEVREILDYYHALSPQLADDFWLEMMEGIDGAAKNPEHHHFDRSGRRRCNLRRFPYHFLFRMFDDYIRITVVRHNRRHPSFGSGRR